MMPFVVYQTVKRKAAKVLL